MSVRSNGSAPTHLGEAPQRGLSPEKVSGIFSRFSRAGHALRLMGRPKRVTAGGYAYHVVNRGNGRMRIFDDDGDCIAFEKDLGEALECWPEMGLVSYCLMPSSWHLVVRPDINDILPRLMGWLTVTHTQRWHAHRKTTGGGGRTAVRRGWSR